MELEGTARYTGLLLAPAEGFVLWPRFVWPLGKRNWLFILKIKKNLKVEEEEKSNNIQKNLKDPFFRRKRRKKCYYLSLAI